MVSSIYASIVIHIQTYNRPAYLYSQSYKLLYILLKLFKLGYLVFSNADVFFYFQFIFDLGSQEVNGVLILVV